MPWLKYVISYTLITCKMQVYGLQLVAIYTRFDSLLTLEFDRVLKLHWPMMTMLPRMPVHSRWMKVWVCRRFHPLENDDVVRPVGAWLKINGSLKSLRVNETLRLKTDEWRLTRLPVKSTFRESTHPHTRTRSVDEERKSVWETKWKKAFRVFSRISQEFEVCLRAGNLLRLTTMEARNQRAMNLWARDSFDSRLDSYKT